MREKNDVRKYKKKNHETKPKRKRRSDTRRKRHHAGSKTGLRTKKRTRGNNSSKQSTKKSRIITLFFDILFIFLIISMLGGAAIFTISQKKDKSFYGYRFYDVLTNSMVKTKDGQKGNFSAGDMVVVKVEESNNIQVGDIITFVPNKKSVDTHLTHRVIEKASPKAALVATDKGESNTVDNYPVFITQGDANNLADPPVSGDLVIGVVKFSIPKAGALIKFIRSNMIAVMVFVLSFFGLLLLVRDYFAPENKEK